MLDCFTKKRKIKLGVAPLRRTAYSHKPFNLNEAIKYKNIILEVLKKFDVELVTLEGITEDGLLFNVSDADRAAKYFTQKEVDGVFIPHCNFGSEESAARLGKGVGKPVLLWGPKDYINPNDLYRYRDSQCGLFATSKVLRAYGVSFTYIENCDADDPIFADGFNKFIRVVSVVKAFRSLRIGQIGTRPAPFVSVKCNELELLQKFGIEVLPMTMADLKLKFEAFGKENEALIGEKTAEMKKIFITNGITDDQLQRIAVLKLTVEQWAREEDLSAVTAMCWGPMVETVGISPCFVLGEVCDDGLPFICESDIHGAITAVIAMAANRYASPVFLADITIRHPENKNTELLWHCGVFAKGLARKDEPLVIANHYNRLCPAVGQWELREGNLNIIRFDGCDGEYSIFLGGAKGVRGPKTVGAFVWIEVDDWGKWEQKLIYGPYVHHCVGIYDEVKDVVVEACRYIPGLHPDLV